MDVTIQCKVRRYMSISLSYVVATLYIPDLPLSSTISWNLTQIYFIMKIIMKVGFHHIVQMCWVLNVVSSTSLDAIIPKSENVVKYYVKSFGKI